MKKLLFFILVLHCACTPDEGISEGQRGPFVGQYVGVFNCVGELGNDNGEEFEIEIAQTANNSYDIEIEDEYYLTAFLENGVLVLPFQDIEQLFGLDFVNINGTISILDEINLSFDFYIDSDDGETSCVTILFAD